MKKTLSILLALVLVISVAAVAAAEDTGTAETTETEATVYTLEEMLTLAMTDAYTRQAAYAAYAEAFPDNRALSNLNIDSQIVLLEMLLKANGAALPAIDAEATVPETEKEALTAVAQAERNTIEMLGSYLSQTALTKDARMVFRMVAQDSRDKAAAYTGRARAAKRMQEWTDFVNSDDVQRYVYEGESNNGNGSWTMYVITNRPPREQPGQPATEPAAEPTAEPAP